MATNSSMNFCDDVWPPGFRFHPTDEELLLYYLKRKICRRKLKLDLIAEIDVYKWDPEELPGLSLLKNGDRQWFFFSPRDRKYPNGSRSNRATGHGYWKATGKDRAITCNSRNVGIKKTLVFYRGRAPTGARTDWVMHEYTLEEEELKRCHNAQDYYAIYKLFKKSGPGPKNGEQYGAPFREEDWVDDDCAGSNRNSDQPIHAQQENNVLAITSCGNAQLDVSWNNVDEFVNRVVDDRSPQPENIDNFELALSQFVGEEETQGIMGNRSFEEAIYTQGCEQNGLEASLNITQSATFGGLEQWDLPEVTSVSENDFLEMDDLLAPQPLPHSTGYTLQQNSQLGEDDVFAEFFDADAVLRDLGSIDQPLYPYRYPSFEEGGFENQIGFQMEPYPDASYGIGNEILTPYANNFLHTTTEPNQEPIPLPTTGVVYAGNPVSNSNELNQNQSNGRGEDDERAPPSSNLWSFVDSIPSPDASATELASVNKALQRIYSFSRIRLNAKNSAPIVVSKASAVVGRSRVFFLFSFLAALFAIVCLFIGSNSSVSRKLHCRMDL